MVSFHYFCHKNHNYGSLYLLISPFQLSWHNQLPVKFENKKMKTHIKHLILAFLTTFIFACNNNESEEDSIKYQCKSENRDSFIIDLADTLSCVNYTYSASTDKLVLEHINTAFNCCPGTIGWTVRVSQDSILTEERASRNDCFCECLYRSYN
jgi:hypothetical protein